MKDDNILIIDEYQPPSLDDKVKTLIKQNETELTALMINTYQINQKWVINKSRLVHFVSNFNYDNYT